MSNINDKLDNVLEELSESIELSQEQVSDILSILRNIDTDMVPLIDIIEVSINNFESSEKRGALVKKVLEFYGFNNNDILKCRQKFMIQDHKLVKKPFLKQNQKEYINILLKEYGVL